MKISVAEEEACMVHLLQMSIFLTPLRADLYEHLRSDRKINFLSKANPSAGEINIVPITVQKNFSTRVREKQNSNRKVCVASMPDILSS